MVTPRFIWCFVALAIVLSSTIVRAQTVPDAGALRQQIEQNQQPNMPRKAMPAKPAEPVEMQPQKGVIITVKAFRFIGNTLLTAKQLEPVIKSFLNRSLDFNQLQAAATAVANAYREAGWIVRAYLPQQDIVDGVVTIQIVEAVFGEVRLESQPPTRVKLGTVMSFFNGQQKSGELFNTDALDRALLIADDLPGVAVSGSLSAGAQASETDLVVKLADEPLVVGEAGVDNTGSRSTGSDRFTANVNLNSPIKIGDQISANYIHTRGSDYLRLGETLPAGSNGWRLGINASYLDYKLVADEFSTLNAKGTSGTFGLEASYPIIRSRLKNLYFNANIDDKSFDNQASGATTTNYKADALSLSLNGNLFDNIGGGGANSASLSLVEGLLNLNGSPNQAADATTTQTAGHYAKLHYSASRQQVMTEDRAFFGSLSGQISNKNLDSSEKYYLGGSNGVRAYPANEGGGSEGELINLELRRKLPKGFNLVGFYDFGHVTLNHNNNFTGAAALNDYSLKGVGLSLAWQSGNGPSLKATWSRRLGDNPNPTASGNDQDGTLLKNRFWLVGIQQF